MTVLLSLLTVPAHADPDFRYRVDAFVAVGTGTTARSVAIGDVTGDGKNDVLLGTYETPSTGSIIPTLFVFPQRPNGTLGGGTRYVHGCDGESLALVDLNEDGVDDVVTGGRTPVGNFGCYSVFIASGTGTLAPPDAYGASGYVSAIVPYDIDDDTHMDIISTGAVIGNTGFIDVVPGDGAGNLAARRTIASDAPLVDCEIGDLDGDGLVDVAAVDNRPPGSVNVYSNDPSTIFSTTYRVYPYTGQAQANALGVGDMNGDGLDDVMISGQQMYRHLQQGNGTLATGTLVPSNASPQAIVIADVDVDGDEDVVVAYSGARAIGVFLQVNGALEAEDTYAIPFSDAYGTTALAVGDLNSDGCPDVALADQNDGLVTLIGHCDADSDGDGIFDKNDLCPYAPFIDANDDGADDDADADTVPDACDVCIDVADPAQVDQDQDGVGDLCDICPDTYDPSQIDRDGDGHSDVCDVCPNVADADQKNADGDDRGDVCDICPSAFDDQSDADGDGLGDACETCPGVADDGADGDADGLADACDCAPDDATRPTVTGACEPPIDPAEVGCGCQTTPSPAGALGLFAALALLAGRRRRA